MLYTFLLYAITGYLLCIAPQLPALEPAQEPPPFFKLLECCSLRAKGLAALPLPKYKFTDHSAHTFNGEENAEEKDIDTSQLPAPSYTLSSPLYYEAEGGDLLYVSFVVKNESGNSFTDEFLCSLPNEWLLLFSEKKFSIPPESCQVKVVAIKIPKDSLAGHYYIPIASKTFPEYKAAIKIFVKSKIGFECTAINSKPLYSPFEPIDLLLEARNRGNSGLNIAIEALTDPLCPVFYDPSPLFLPSGSSAPIKIRMKPRYSPDEAAQFLRIKIVDIENDLPIFQDTISFNFQPKEEEDPFYTYIPGYARAIALGDNSKQVVAAEYAGGGIIDQVRERYLEYFFRLPSDLRNVVYSQEQRLYLAVSEPHWHLDLGDTVYEQGYLMQGSRYGRGAGFFFEKNRWAFDLHYTQNIFKNDYDPKEFCASTTHFFNPKWQVTANYLHKNLECISPANLGSLYSSLEYPQNIVTEVEFAKNFTHKNGGGRGVHAFHIESQGYWKNDCWFDFNKTYSAPAFYGYYNHLNLFSSTLDFPLKNRWHCTLSNVKFKQVYNGFCKNNPEGPAPKQNQSNIIFTKPLSSFETVIFNGLFLRGEDSSPAHEYDFFQRWGIVTFLTNRMNLIFSPSLSLGYQNDYKKRKKRELLQKYSFFIEKNFGAKFTGTLFSDLGNINYYEADHWGSALGASVAFRYSPLGSCKLFAQTVKHSHEKYNFYQTSFNLSHQFKSRHQLIVTLEYYHYRSHYPNDAKFFISYTIPFNTLWGPKKDVGAIKGIVYDPANQSGIAEALICCSGKKATTDQYGRFTLYNLPLGETTIKTEKLPDNFIGTTISPQTVEIKGGKYSSAALKVLQAATIEGEVYLNEEQTYLEENEIKIMPGQMKKLASVGISISASNGTEHYFTRTDSSGWFRFIKLRPGKWLIRVSEETLPPFYFFDRSEVEIELSPGIDQSIAFRATLQKSVLYRLD